MTQADRRNPDFLEEAATRDQLLRAVASNHRQWMIHGARVRGGEAHRENGALWIYTPGPTREVMIPFPRLAPESASAQLDQIMEFCRRHRPLHHIGCWSLDAGTPTGLGARLLARGFEWGWAPHWMWLDLRRLSADHPRPAGLRVEPADEGAVWDVEDLPYYRRETEAPAVAGTPARRRRMCRFAAWMDGRVVGHSAVFLTTGRLGVAGIYNCGVVPAARNQGIGRAVTVAACRHAQAMGCHHALLNATGMGEPVYRRLGFESLGHGQTWWLHRATLEARPPGRQRVAVAEAVGLGELATLERVGRRMKPEALDTPLPGGMTLLQIAVQTGRPAAAEWLVEHGATLDVLSAWDLGWKDRLTRALAASPELANRRSGGWQTTPLHAAAERGDAELARALLAADPDLEIADTQFRSTPLGWARHLGRTEIIELIEQHQTRHTHPERR